MRTRSRQLAERRFGIIAMLCCIVAVTACQSDSAVDQALACSDSSPLFTQTDSAGVTLALNGAARQSFSLIGRSPTTVFGAESDAPVTPAAGEDANAKPIFFGDITHARTLPDGTVLVVDGKSVAVRLFTSDGEYLRDIGRQGRGPGEFTRASDVFVGVADTLWIFDGRGRRLLGYGGNADFVPLSTVSLPRKEMLQPSKVAGGEPLRVGWPFVPRAQLKDGRWLLSVMATTASQQEISRVSRDSAQLHVWDARTDSSEPRNLLLGTQRYELFTNDGWTTFGTVPLGFTESFAAAPDRYFVGDGSSFSIAEHAANGALTRVIRVCTPPVIVSEQIADSIDDAADAVEAARGPSTLPHEADARRFVPRPRPAPSYYELLYDRANRLWVREFTVPGAPHRWSVFSANGERVLQLSLPANQTVLDAGSDHVLVRNQTELGEATLHRYPLP